MLKPAGAKDAVKSTVAKLIKKFNELGVMSFTRGPGSILEHSNLVSQLNSSLFVCTLYQSGVSTSSSRYQQPLTHFSGHDGFRYVAANHRDMREQLIRIQDRLVVGEFWTALYRVAAGP